MVLNQQDSDMIFDDSTSKVFNEVVITTIPEARNDDLPHSLDVTRGGAVEASSYGDNNIDGFLQRHGIGVRSIERVFVPTKVAQENSLGTTISAEYDEDEHQKGFSRSYKIVFESDIYVERLCDELKKSNVIEDASPNFLSKICKTPNDSLYVNQWGPKIIDSEEAWDIETGHDDVVIAILDSGVDLNHKDLKSKLLPGYDFVNGSQYGWDNDYGLYTAIGDYRTRDNNPSDENGHGTHCAGVAAAVSNNQTGITGMCWGGKILPVRVMYKIKFTRYKDFYNGIGSSTDIAQGIKYAADQNADVISMSLGGSQFPPPAQQKAVKYAYDKGVCLIAANGNNGTSQASYPAAFDQTLAVGAVDHNKNRANFSQYGSSFGKFVMAPGVDIVSTYLNNQYVKMSGTSMATPHVAGLAALIISVAKRNKKTPSVEDVYSIIRDTATKQPGQTETFYGQGLVNAKAALEAAKKKFCS
ncbi:MAG: peptidase S8 [Okeania sp. SIO3H1]|nr:peptidase S8 [Okeania sp. SIO3H1]